MTEEIDTKYIAIKCIELICIGFFIFGALWEGTIRFNLTTPQFFMVYGGVGAIFTEIIGRIFKKMEKNKPKKKSLTLPRS